MPSTKKKFNNGVNTNTDRDNILNLLDTTIQTLMQQYGYCENSIKYRVEVAIEKVATLLDEGKRKIPE